MRAQFLLTALALSASAWGQEIALDLNPAHTTMHFTLPATMHTVHGTFNLKHGAIRYDPATGKITGDIVVDATSAKSGNDSRDRKMHKDVLESARYPEISFTPDRVDGTVAPQGDSRVQVHGMFHIHGAAHEITIPVKVRMIGGQAAVSANFTIPYVAWGMKNPSTFFLHVGEKVEIDAVTGALP